MREVICDLLLREVEQLIERYFRKMRKSFSRMRWDDEAGEVSATDFMTDAIEDFSFT